MENTSITFKEFTKAYIRNFPDEFRYLQTPVQIYDMDDLSVKNLVTPTPLLKADFNFIVFATHGNFEQQVGNEIKKVSAHQALLVLQGKSLHYCASLPMYKDIISPLTIILYSRPKSTIIVSNCLPQRPSSGSAMMTVALSNILAACLFRN